MRHGVDFFRDEIRNGFYIPAVVKQSWAASLDVLFEIDRICRAHGIRYFADWGSFLGAVRHGGFVPWDDDLDICMLREDYDKFRAVCDAELPENYCIHDYERHEGHWLFLARVVNNHHIRFDDEHLLNNYNFPWLSGVDIFLKDYLYDDPAKEKERDDRIMRLLAEAEGYIRECDNIQGKLAGNEPGNKMADRDGNRKKAVELYRKAEVIMGEVKKEHGLEANADKKSCDNENGQRVGQIFPWILKGGKGEPASYYDEVVWLPFEDTGIPVPACYNKVLSGRYGDYNVVRKGVAGHDYPSFEGQRKSFEAETGTALPRFTFDAGMLERPVPITRDYTLGDTEDGQTKATSARREVLFLPVGPSEWKSFESSFAKECTDPETDVYVVPLPLMHRNFYGEIMATDEEILEAEHFEDYVNIMERLTQAGVNTDNVYLTGFTDYDLSQHCLDRIYIQNPYDDQNPVLTVPPYYYSDNLRHFTPELIYIPLGPVGEYAETDLPDMIGMKFYVCMPGVIGADKVYVQSENIRGHYVKVLAEFAKGAGNFDKKVVSVQDIYCQQCYYNSKDTNHLDTDSLLETQLDTGSDCIKKRILYGIAPYEYYENRDRYDDAIKSRMDIFEENADKIEVVVFKYPEDADILNESGDIAEFVSSFDAYYGSSMPLVQEFIAQKKPVMIANYEL